jgi:hypothetical protein
MSAGPRFLVDDTQTYIVDTSFTPEPRIAPTAPNGTNLHQTRQISRQAFYSTSSYISEAPLLDICYVTNPALWMPLFSDYPIPISTSH